MKTERYIKIEETESHFVTRKLADLITLIPSTEPDETRPIDVATKKSGGGSKHQTPPTQTVNAGLTPYDS